jgi:hypothetical protein
MTEEKSFRTNCIREIAVHSCPTSNRTVPLEVIQIASDSGNVQDRIVSFDELS